MGIGRLDVVPPENPLKSLKSPTLRSVQLRRSNSPPSSSRTGGCIPSDFVLRGDVSELASPKPKDYDGRMKTTMVIALALLVLGMFIEPSEAQESTDTPDAIHQLLKQHCLDCHNSEDREAGLDLGSLPFDLARLGLVDTWERIYDQLDSGKMPPVGSDGPSPELRAEAVRLLGRELTQAHLQRRDVVHRRMNRVEYQNSVRDLFQIDVTVAELLPTDTSTNGFDNVGEGLAFSAEAAEAYLAAADKVLDAVIGPKSKPEFIRHETNLLDQKHWNGKPALEQVGKMFRRTDDGLVIFQSGYCPTNLINFARLRAPVGTYRGTLKVRAVQSDEPVTLRIYGGDTIVGRRDLHLVGYFDVPPGEWTTIEFTDKLIEPNGTFQPKCYGTRDTRQDADTYPEPGIEIGDIVIEGPIESWPPLSRSQLLGDVELDSGTYKDLRSILARVLPRAFRRPVPDNELEVYASLGEHALRVERPFEEALRLSLKAMLCSPEFLFFTEPATETLNDFALATRLSYFLWSSLPDEELLNLASRNELHQPAVLRSQTERMLKDPKAAAFTQNFTGQWLRLRDLDFTTPDAQLYPEYDELLRISMLKETHLFFGAILEDDLSLLNFVDSRFTFLNQRMAEHYNIPGVKGQAFRRVDLPDDHVRGGVLTQASLLKVTANGTTTSPVTRGVWVLDNLLGQRVPPPPANVPAVEPDIRGAVTLRQQLAKHRDVESCSICHDRIDPAGFALENFDVIGGWRDHYRSLEQGDRPEFSQDPHTFAWIRWRFGLEVDASGTTPDGTSFQDIRDFKRWLLGNPDQLTLALTDKMMTYALGRRLGFSDRTALNQIATQVKDQNYGFRSLLHAIVQHELFRTP